MFDLADLFLRNLRSTMTYSRSTLSARSTLLVLFAIFAITGIALSGCDAADPGAAGPGNAPATSASEPIALGTSSTLVQAERGTPSGTARILTRNGQTFVRFPDRGEGELRFTFRVPETGRYRLTFFYSSGAVQPVEVEASGVLAGADEVTFNLPSSGGQQAPAIFATPASFLVEAGAPRTLTITSEAASGGWNLDALLITFTPADAEPELIPFDDVFGETLTFDFSATLGGEVLGGTLTLDVGTAGGCQMSAPVTGTLDVGNGAQAVTDGSLTDNRCVPDNSVVRSFIARVQPDADGENGFSLSSDAFFDRATGRIQGTVFSGTDDGLFEGQLTD